MNKKRLIFIIALLIAAVVAATVILSFTGGAPDVENAAIDYGTSELYTKEDMDKWESLKS